MGITNSGDRSFYWDSIKYGSVRNRRDLSNDNKKTSRSKFMEFRHYQGRYASNRKHSTRIRTLPTSSSHLPTNPFLKRFNVKKAIIPFAVLSSTFLFGTIEAHAFSLNPFQTIVDDWEAIKQWFKDLPHNIAKWSIEMMVKLYELCTSLVLQTPLWLFDNSWFKNTTYKFSLIAIGLVSVLTSVEGIKRMLPKFSKKNKSEPMGVKEIGKRWFLVAGAMSIVPFLFQKAFEFLNWLSKLITNISGDNIKEIAMKESISFFDVLFLLIFDVVLISTLVPMLWVNGRRFYDLTILAASTPFALTAWIFKSYRHFFEQWKSNLIHLSLVQVYYAFFLLALGFFLFGIPTPNDFTGMLTKFMVIIGGFNRLQNPPRIIASKLDNGGGFDEVLSGAKGTIDKTKRNIEFTKGLLTRNPKKVFDALSGDKFSNAKILPVKKEAVSSYSKKGGYKETRSRKKK